MYAALWRALPGPLWLRILLLLVLLVAVLYALVTWVFPWIDGFTAASDSTVGTP